MTASASSENKREDFARSLSIFARELCGGEGALRPDGTPVAMSESVAEAFAAGRWAQGASDARLEAYRILVRRFLRQCARVGAAPEPLPVRGHARPYAQSAALQTHPAPEIARTLDALRRLAPVERAALLLVAVERFSYAEAADVMEMEKRAFVAALTRAREAFAARLALSATPGRPHLRVVE
jgi:RNA polymerase sigma-70 factor, ECF subfamily